MEETLRVVVYIPVPGSRLAQAIEPGSVVVPIGNPRPDGVRAVTWEARGFNERVPSTFADRAERAYTRSRDHRNDLRRLIDGSEIRAIGRLDTSTGEIELEYEQDAADLAAWLGRPALDPAELTTTRGVVVQMVRASVREHGDQLAGQEAAQEAAHGGRQAHGHGHGHGSGLRSQPGGRRSHWYT